ncbi:TRAP transporter substrate-binding protein [Salinarimonas ramus]|uniref:C4-dicarboxylate ABC transporter substrate-binding protein n=1 Tax=Salinarimonas ramus TaxID=690164 RepID=A0A917V1N5_9HYPH|nr:TRAP transporter substrate-binding protein [Salinarimonas ramus]GGK21104.1 C4-dicarboxylate ABC transporter substrate-binding protein [Salinarimonas ramus]
MSNRLAALLASAGAFALVSGAALAQTPLKIGHGHSDQHSFHLAMERFAELLEEKAPGAFDVQIFPSAQLGSEREMQEQLALGNLEMTVTGVLGIYEPKLALLELPFLFRDREHILAAQDSEAVSNLAASLPDKGLRLVGFVENGFRNITNNVRPIETPADVDGLQIRTPENPAQIETFRALGASPTPMPFSELYAALRQGVVDGQENPLQNIYDGKLFEVQEHLALTGHIYNSAYIVASEGWLQGLSEEERTAVLEAAEEAGNWQFEYIAARDEELLSALEEAGMRVTRPDRQPFVDATQPAYDVFYERFGDDARTFVEAIRAL